MNIVNTSKSPISKIVLAYYIKFYNTLYNIMIITYIFFLIGKTNVNEEEPYDRQFEGNMNLPRKGIINKPNII